MRARRCLDRARAEGRRARHGAGAADVRGYGLANGFGARDSLATAQRIQGVYLCGGQLDDRPHGRHHSTSSLLVRGASPPRTPLRAHSLSSPPLTNP